jgi:hypothetical protein
MERMRRFKKFKSFNRCAQFKPLPLSSPAMRGRMKEGAGTIGTTETIGTVSALV